MGYPTQQQKVDYLFKKIGFSASKTGVAEDQTSGFSGDTKKAPPNEAIPSPLVVPASSIWADTSYIPATPPTSSNGYVGVYSTATAYRMTVDTSVSNNRAFVARSTWSNHSSAIDGDWIDTQFGADYLIKVYKGDPSVGAPGVAYTNITAAGTGGGPDDTWFFDYSSGVLNFNGADLDGQLVGIHTDNVYIVGYRYLGTKGVQPAAGIGTFHNLYVSGISTFAGNAYANSDLLIAENKVHTGDTNTKITFPSAGDQITFRTAGSQRVGIGTDGKVGVGYNFIPSTYQFEVRSPSATAYAANGTNAAIALGNNNSSAATNSTGIHMFTDGNGRGVVNLNALNNSTNASADFTIQTRHSGTLAERLRIKSDGKVGIAQASPDYALDVTGSIGFTSQMRGASGSASAPAYSFDGDSDTGMFRGGAVNVLSFATAGTERLNITPAGKVGIGTITHNNVTSQLHIVEPTEGNSVIQLNSGDGYPGVNRNLTIKSGTGGWAGAKWIFDAVSSGGQLEFQTTSIKRLHILHSGYVGIGSGTPSAWLDVNANSAASLQIKNTGTVNSMLMSIDSTMNSLYSRGVNSSTGRDFRILQGSTEKLRIRKSGDIHIVNNVNVVGVSTFNANVQLLDDDKLLLGGAAGSHDGLELYHDSNNSYIADTGTGSLIIKGADVEIQTAGGNKYFTGAANVAKLYHTNLEKLSTKAWGIEVTGTLDTDQLVVSGISTFTGAIDANGNLDVDGYTELDDLNVSGVSTFAGNVDVNASADISGNLVVGAGGTTITTIVGAAASVGIGSATPDYMLDVAGAINSETDIKVQGVSVSETALNDAVAMAIALG